MTFCIENRLHFLWCKGATYALTSRLYSSLGFLAAKQLVFQVHCTDRHTVPGYCSGTVFAVWSGGSKYTNIHSAGSYCFHPHS